MTTGSLRIAWLGALACAAGLTLVVLGTWVLTDEAVGVVSGDRGTAPALAGVSAQEVPNRTAVAIGLALAATGTVALAVRALRRPGAHGA